MPRFEDESVQSCGFLKFAAHRVDPEKAGLAPAARLQLACRAECCCAHVIEVLTYLVRLKKKRKEFLVKVYCRFMAITPIESPFRRVVHYGNDNPGDQKCNEQLSHIPFPQHFSLAYT